jgi:hypothetical protein
VNLEILSVARSNEDEQGSQSNKELAILRANSRIPTITKILTCYRDTERGPGGSSEQLAKEKHTLAKLFNCQCCECAGQCGGKENVTSQDALASVGMAIGVLKRKPTHLTPSNLLPEVLTAVTLNSDVESTLPTQQKRIQRAGFSNRPKRRAGRVVGPIAGPGLGQEWEAEPSPIPTSNPTGKGKRQGGKDQTKR